jgi:hypothetical protein
MLDVENAEEIDLAQIMLTTQTASSVDGRVNGEMNGMSELECFCCPQLFALIKITTYRRSKWTWLHFSRMNPTSARICCRYWTSAVISHWDYDRKCSTTRSILHCGLHEHACTTTGHLQIISVAHHTFVQSSMDVDYRQLVVEMDFVYDAQICAAD